MQYAKSPRKRRLMFGDIGTGKDFVEVSGRGLVIVGFQHVDGQRFSEAPRSHDAYIVRPTVFKQFNKLRFINNGHTSFADGAKIRLAPRQYFQSEFVGHDDFLS